MTFLNLGEQPPANALLKDEAQEETSYPLALCSCPTCGLIQLSHVVRAELLFKEYFYFSSVSKGMEEHFAVYADDIARRFVPENGLVVEIGSNDGVLLKSLIGCPLRILGVDPAKNVAETAQKNGVPTLTGFFDEVIALSVRKEMGPASVIIANNVFAHVDDLDTVMRGIGILLDDNGVFVIETPHVASMLANLEFDTVYHEHLSYFGIKSLSALFDRFGFEIFDVKRQSVHGGSIRVFVRQRRDKCPPPSEMVAEAIRIEEHEGVFGPNRLESFAHDVAMLRVKLKGLIAELKGKGKKIAGYGAPAKGTVLLNYCGFTTDDIGYLVDATPVKQGRFCPGVHIPIRPPEFLHADMPDYALLLAWNHREEILEKESRWRHAGGKFIIPIPRVEIV